MLEAVVEQVDAGAEGAQFGEEAAGGDAVCADGEGGATVAEQELGFFAGEFHRERFAGQGGDRLAGGAAVAAGKDGGADAARGEFAAEPTDQRRLARAARGEVADADDGAAEGARARAREDAVEGHTGEPQARKGLKTCRARQAEIVKSSGGPGGAGGGAAAPGGEAGGKDADFRAKPGIEEEAFEGGGQFLRRGQRNERVIFAEFRGAFGEIFHVRPGEDGDAEGGGLEDVVAAAAGEGAAHEDGGGDAEKGGELADGVQQEHAGQREGIRRRQLGAAEKGDAAGGEFLAGGGEGLRAAGGEDEEEAGEAGGKGEEGVKDGAVLVGVVRGGGGHGGGRDPDRGRLQGVEKLLNVGRDFCGIRIEIVLEVSGDFDVFGAERAVARGGGGVLGEDEVGEGEDVAEETAEAEVAGEGAVRDAGVDDEEAGAVAAGFAKEVGPDFGFGNDEERGADAAEDAAHGEAVVDGSEEDAVGQGGELLLADGASGEGGCGDVKRDAGEGLPQAAEEGDGGEGFADADGVQPDGAGGRREEMAGEEAEAFAEGAEVAAVFDAAETQVE